MSKTYIINYTEYDRHVQAESRPFLRTGKSIIAAVKKLPKEVLLDVFWDEETLEEATSSKTALVEYLSDIDVGGFSFITIFEQMGEEFELVASPFPSDCCED